MSITRVFQTPQINNSNESGITDVLGSLGFNTDSGLMKVLIAPSILKSFPFSDGTGATGTWNINILGNAATATSSGSASTVSTSNEASDTTCFPAFFTASGTQSLQPKNNTSLTFNSSTGYFGASGLTLGTAALSGIVPAINMTSTYSDGNYINFGGSGRNIGITSSGALFSSYNLNWNATTNAYQYVATGNAISLELGSSSYVLSAYDPGGPGDPITPPFTSMTFDVIGLTMSNGLFVGNLQGNSDTATALENPRTIGGVSFNGTANIVPQTIQSINESSDTTCFPLFISASGSQSLQPLNNAGLIYNASTNALTATSFIGSITGNASTATALQTPRAIYGNNFDGTAALTQIIASTFGGTGNGFAKFSGPTTSEKTFSLPDASATILTNNTAVTVAQGGTGQSSYTNGQLLIGNTTGNTLAKATLTGTANQVIVTNGTGTITLSAPQDIGTGSSPTFSALTLSGSPATVVLNFNNGGAGTYLGTNGTRSGVVSGGDYFTARNIAYDGTTFTFIAGAGSGTGGITRVNGSSYTVGFATGGTAGGTASFTTSLTVDTNVTANSGHLIVNTAGKTLEIKQGSNACAGTGAVMVAGAVTVSTTAVATGDIILLTKTAAGGTSGAGMPVITISNGVSFTITGTATDTSTWSWVIIKAA